MNHAEAAPHNNSWLDIWSLTHLIWAVFLALVLPPFWALAIMVLWEPLEVLVLSPILARVGVVFGKEGLRNSLMDIVVDVAGVALGAYWIRPNWNPFAGLF